MCAACRRVSPTQHSFPLTVESLAGLAGCGVATETAAIGTQFTVEFLVFDRHVPAASASVTKTITVVSPCTDFQLFCPGLQPECAADLPCALRSEPSEEQPLSRLAASPESAFPSGAVVFSADANAATVHTVCGYPPSVILDVCPQTATNDSSVELPACVFSAPDPTQAHTISSVACPFEDAVAGTCSVCPIEAARSGGCGAGSAEYSVILGDAQAFAASLTVSVAPLVAEVTFRATADISIVDPSPLLGGPANSGFAAALQSTMHAQVASSACVSADVDPELATEVLRLHVVVQQAEQQSDAPGLSVEVLVAVGLEGTSEAGSDADSAASSFREQLPGCLAAAIGSEIEVAADHGSVWAGQALVVDNSSVVATAASCPNLTEQELLDNWLVATESALTVSMSLMLVAATQVLCCTLTLCACALDSSNMSTALSVCSSSWGTQVTACRRSCLWKHLSMPTWWVPASAG